MNKKMKIAVKPKKISDIRNSAVTEDAESQERYVPDHPENAVDRAMKAHAPVISQVAAAADAVKSVKSGGSVVDAALNVASTAPGVVGRVAGAISTVKSLGSALKEDAEMTTDSVDHKKFGPMLDTFTAFASKKLGIKSMPNMKLTKDDLETTFGGYNPAEKSIVVVSKNRHPMDIFRTVAHELVHHKQNEDGRLGKDIAQEGSTGSDIENEANSEAGKIMRWFAKASPETFKSKYVVESKKIGKKQKVEVLKPIAMKPGVASRENDTPVTAGEIDQASRLGLLYYGFGRYGKTINGQHMVTHVGRKGQLVAKQKMVAEDKMKVDEAFETFMKENTPSDREWGLKSLTKIYKKETPGEGKKILKKRLTQEAEPPFGYEFGNNGIGPTVGPTKTVGGIVSGFSLPMSESTRRGGRSLSSIRESWDAKGGRDMGTTASTFKDDITEEEDDKGVVNLSKVRDDKKVKDFHKGFMGDMKDRANEYAERVQKHIDDGKFPMKVGDRFSTQHSRDNDLPPTKITGYYVDKKNPDGHYGYHVERQVDGDVERSQLAIRHPGLEKLHGPKKWAQLQAGMKKFEPLKSIKEGSEAWTRKEGKNPDGGLNKKGVASYRAANPGSKLQTAVTTEPSKLKPGSKKAKRRLSFCRRMSGMKSKLTSAKTARDPDSRINKSLRKWNCEE